ncbi:MAG: thiosulfate oxidation carrier complex protein SoxZ [Chromatiales bacterium]|nr:thiosulfate oxidation carrier complex protein SoxZ [Chromatiales bacterium]
MKHISLIFTTCIASVFLSGCVTSGGNQQNTYSRTTVTSTTSSIEAQTPSKVEQGGIVPIEVNIKDPKGVRSIELTIPTNSEGHKKALIATFETPIKEQSLSTRLRFSASNNAKVMITTINGEGKKSEKAIFVGEIQQPVDYSHEASLYSTFPGDARIFKDNTIGQAKIALTNRGTPQVRGILKHPMRPSINSTTSLLIEEVEFHFDGQRAITMEWNDALSNDPYIGVGVQTLPKAAKIVWRDTKGSEFSASSP